MSTASERHASMLLDVLVTHSHLFIHGVNETSQDDLTIRSMDCDHLMARNPLPKHHKNGGMRSFMLFVHKIRTLRIDSTKFPGSMFQIRVF